MRSKARNKNEAAWSDPKQKPSNEEEAQNVNGLIKSHHIVQ